MSWEALFHNVRYFAQDYHFEIKVLDSTRKDAACPGGWVAFFIARGFGQGGVISVGKVTAECLRQGTPVG